MGYKKAGDGRVIKKGKTDVEIFPDDGPHIVQKMKSKAGTGLNAAYKAVGRNLARAHNQKPGSK